MSDSGHIELRPAAGLPGEALADLFTRSYSGYFVDVRVDAAAFATMAELQDVALPLSVVALVDNTPAGIALLARRGARGWIGGMGVAAEARGHGLGRRLMEAVVESARAAGLATVQLEVIDRNHWAAAIYEALGFRDRRALEVLVRPSSDLASEAEPPGAAEAIPLESWLAERERLGGSELPWQREGVALLRQSAQLETRVWRGSAGIEAGLVYRATPARGGIADAVLAPGAPPASLEALLRLALSQTAAAGRGPAEFSLINLPAGDPALPVLHPLGFERRFLQREMSLAL